MYTENKEDIWRHSEKVSIYKPEKEVLPETNPDGNLTLNFQLLELWENEFPSFKPPSLGYLVNAAPQEYSHFQVLNLNHLCKVFFP